MRQRTVTPTRIAIALCLASLTACSMLAPAPPVPIVEPLTMQKKPAGLDPQAPRRAPMESRHFLAVAKTTEVLGQVQALFAHHENTFADLARQHNLGYQALRNANPAVDPWLPGEGTPVYLPTMAIVPDVARDGIVVNLPSMRLLYFVPDGTGEGKPTSHAVTSHPIGIGREGWATPTGDTHITEKKRNPSWYPPASVRAEHQALGDPLPAVVPPGPDNPLGQFKMRLAMPGYLIHGTNKPSGVGMRVSHGCIRLYPEDIETLFDRVPSRTPVHIINQPVLAGWRNGQLYLEVHPPLSEDQRDLAFDAEVAIEAALLRAGRGADELDGERVAQIVAEMRGLPIPILSHSAAPIDYLTASRIIHNTAPAKSDGELAGQSLSQAGSQGASLNASAR